MRLLCSGFLSIPVARKAHRVEKNIHVSSIKTENWKSDSWTAAGVQKIGEIVVDLRNANLNKFKRRWKFRQDNYIYNLQYELQIMFGKREGVLFVRAKNGNEVFGKAYIEYDTE